MVDETLIGRVVVKTTGRDAGLKAVVLMVYDDGYALVTGPKKLTGLRRRKVNVMHLLPTPHRINIPKESSDEEVLKTIKEAGLEKYMVEKHVVKSTTLAEKV